jgi:hypothetical protein
VLHIPERSPIRNDAPRTANRPKRALIVASNPFSFCIGVEKHLATLAGRDAIVDAIDLYSLVTRHSPYYRRVTWRLLEAFNRKYRRFIVPALSGRDITGDIHLDPAAIPPIPHSFEELRDCRQDGANIGLGVLSSIISLTTIQHADSVDELGPEVHASWKAAQLSLQAGKAIRELGYDEVYVFNGRQCYIRPLRDVLEQTARVIKYEVGGCEDTTTFVASDKSVHDPQCFADIIEAHDFDPAEGELYFGERIARSAGNEVNYFIGIQKEGHIPDEVRGKEFVAFFTSSTDERVAALGLHDLGEFSDQCEVALALARSCAREGKQLVVRLHPHLRFKHAAWRREWDFDALAAAGAIVVHPDAKCDSYALARAATCAVTAGSTITFECSFLNVVNAVIGDCLPGRMGASRVCRTEAELAEFVARPSMPEGAREKALVYGSYMRIGGVPIPGYALNGHVSQATLDGRRIDPARAIAHNIRRLLRRK